MQDKGFVVFAFLFLASFVSDSASLRDCSTNPCQNNGWCFNSEMFGYTCQCSGFSGRNCEIDDQAGYGSGGSASTTTSASPSTTTDAINCASAPCLHSGSCSDSPLGGYLCHCPVGFTGVNCEIKQQVGFGAMGLTSTTTLASPSTTTDAINCASAPCLHSGSCSDSPLGGYLCHCPVGFTGVNCEIKPTFQPTTTYAINCASAPCLHSGSCSDSPLGGYLCHCPVGFTGVNCEIKLTTSSSGLRASYCSFHTPCQNGGSCTDVPSESDYECKCPLGFEGKDCQYIVEQPEETKELVLADESCERKVSVGIPEVKYMATLSCEEGTILIKSSVYGSGTHWNAWIEQIGKMCNHESHCKVTAKDDMLDDPLMRIYKRLIIVYECETISPRSFTSSDDDDE